MLSRLETMVLMGVELPLPAIRNQISSGIDILIHLGRLRDKSRRVLSIVEIDGCYNGEIVLNPLYEFEEVEHEQKDDRVQGKLKRVGTLKNKEKLKSHGFEV